MDAAVDIIVFGVASADAITSLEQGLDPIGYAGSVVSTAANGGQLSVSTAIDLGVAAPSISTVASITRSLSGLGVIGAGLTVVQMKIDMDAGKEIKVGDAITVGTAVVGVAIAVGWVPASSIVVPVTTILGVASGISNILGFTLSDVFAKLGELQKGSELTPSERKVIDDFVIKNFDALNSFEEFVSPQCRADYNADQLGNVITTLQSSFQSAKVIDPLILDLDGDGVETISKTAGIHFDHDGNHFSETTGWVGQDDGLLVWDKNGDGKIDTGSELFGTSTLLANGSKAASGYAALADLDGNHDGKIDANDAAFSQLRVWKDGDSNAMVSTGELLTLDDAGVRSLNLGYVNQNRTDSQDSQHIQVGQYTMTNGSTRAMDDVGFAVDTARTVDERTVAVSANIAALPSLRGFGNVPDLQQAMARDASGRLMQLVKSFATTTDATARHALLDQIVWAWTGADQYASNSRGAYIDARQLYSVEAFLGESFNRGVGNPSNSIIAGPLIAAYAQLSQTLYSQLMAQTHFKSLYDTIGLTWNAATLSFDVDVTATIASLRTTYAKDPVAGASWITEFGQNLKEEGAFGGQALSALQGAGNMMASDFLLNLAAIGHDLTTGTENNDTLNGVSDKDNWLLGKGGNDALYGSSHNDVLSGGTGNDSLYGGAGNDIYLFNLGDGTDVITEFDATAGNVDTLKFGDGINADAVQIGQKGYDLILSLNTDDKVVLSNFFNGRNSQVEKIAFADGTAWDVAETVSKQIKGTSYDDKLQGLPDYANNLNGMEGDDAIYGGNKDDILSGGAGKDTLSGGSGNDTYLFNIGDGADAITDFDSTAGNIDTMKFGEGISADAVKLIQNGNDLIFSVNTDDRITISNYFFSRTYQIEKVAFADGTNWGVAETVSRQIRGTWSDDKMWGLSDYANNLNGMEGNDTVYGGNKDDILCGGAGNDSLNGGYGNDTYLFNIGDGTDIITDYDTTNGNTDTLRFGAGISADSVQLGQKGNDLIFSVNANDTVTLSNYFYSKYSQVEKIAFADGTVWDVTATVSKPIKGTSLDDKMWGLSDYANNLNGMEGNDAIYGGSKDDVLSGGAGNDSLNGGYGNDMMQGGQGLDSLYDTSGNNLFDGGEGNDTLTGGSGNEFFIGGSGNDTITTGNGYDVIAFNRGSGQDTIAASTGKDNTLSLGGGISYADLLFSKSGNDLLLKTGAGEQVAFKDWYLSAGYHSIDTLQIVIEGTADYNAVSSNALHNKKIEQFDFEGLASKFDQVRAANPGLTSWALSSALTKFYLGGSNTAAMGGDLAYQYAKNGSLSNLSVMPAQALLNSTQFGVTNQHLQATNALQDLSPRLM